MSESLFLRKACESQLLHRIGLQSATYATQDARVLGQSTSPLQQAENSVCLVSTVSQHVPQRVVILHDHSRELGLDDQREARSQEAGKRLKKAH